MVQSFSDGPLSEGAAELSRVMSDKDAAGEGKLATARSREI